MLKEVERCKRKTEGIANQTTRLGNGTREGRIMMMSWLVGVENEAMLFLSFQVRESPSGNDTAKGGIKGGMPRATLFRLRCSQ